MVGAGIYILTGTVVKDVAGPGIILSFLLAGFVCMLAALCYAEFGNRVPKAGSAYIYTYISMSEFWAFVIGWNILLEQMLVAASVARAWSGYVDSLLGGWIGNKSFEIINEFSANNFETQPDFLACTICLVFALVLGIGVKATAICNGLLTMVNICVMLLVICVGFWYADLKNWSEEEGGFLPFGFVGIINGAATCFYAFVGFDIISTSSEEAKTPASSIPIATILALFSVTAGYILMSAALTLLIPMREINAAASLPEAFGTLNLSWCKYVITIGALFGMTKTLLSSLAAFPRCMYAMASDGLLFSCFGHLKSTTQLPTLNLALAAVSSAILALVFDLRKLLEFLSIGTLLTFTIVSASIIILRYRPLTEPITINNPFYRPYSPDDDDNNDIVEEDNISQISLDTTSPGSDLFEYALTGKLKPKFQWLEPLLGHFEPGAAVSAAVVTFTVTCFIICFQLKMTWNDLYSGNWWGLLLHGFMICIASICVFVIAVHHQNIRGLNFKVPLVPFLPALSIFCNVVLMVHLSTFTWLRFFIWVSLGMLLYFTYGIHHSKEGGTCSSYSMLMTSSEATKSHWGATSPSFEAVFGKSISGAGARKSVFQRFLGRKVHIKSPTAAENDEDEQS